LAFIIIAVGIIFYANGWRWDFKQGRATKIGIIVLKATPKNDLKIYLDGQLQNRTKTPFRIAQVPGAYTLKVEKDGFLSWEKTIQVSEQITSLEENIILVPKDPKTTPLVENPITPQLSPNQREILYKKIVQGKEALYRRAIKNSEEENIYEPKTGTIGQFSWLNNDIVLAQNNQTLLVIDKNNNNQFIISAPGILPETIALNPKNNNEIFGIIDGSLYKFNLLNQKLDLIKQSVSVFKPAQNALFYIKQLEDKTAIFKSDFSGNSEEQLYQFLGTISDIKVIFPNEKQQKIAVLTKSGSLYLVDVIKNEITTLGEGVTFVSWDQGFGQLFFNSLFEAKVYMIQNLGQKFEQSQIITRFSQELEAQSILPEEPETNHIIIKKEGKLFLLETDGKNLTEIKTPEIATSSPVFVDAEGQFVLFLDSKNQLLKLELVRNQGLNIF